MLKIALDALGADAGPQVLVNGALDALCETQAKIFLVGDESKIKPLLNGTKISGNRIEIVHAPDVVTMDVKARDSLRMKESSIAVAMGLVKSGDADGVISAGNTGATTAHALFGLRKLKGIRKPALASIFPTYKNPVLMLDMGATVDCKPIDLLQFSLMGSVYAQQVFGIDKPRVGLLSIGEEDTKGNEATLLANKLLKKSSLNFAGNAEGRDILSGDFDVVVCDGFVGNIILKFGESAVKFLLDAMKEEIFKSPVAKVGGALTKPAMKRLWKRLDKSEQGGAILLGVNGNCFILHGSSNARAITVALQKAEDVIKHHPNDFILNQLEAEAEIFLKEENGN